jgi:hypothetical protein
MDGMAYCLAGVFREMALIKNDSLASSTHQSQ